MNTMHEIPVVICIATSGQETREMLRGFTSFLISRNDSLFT